MCYREFRAVIWKVPESSICCLKCNTNWVTIKSVWTCTTTYSPRHLMRQEKMSFWQISWQTCLHALQIRMLRPLHTSENLLRRPLDSLRELMSSSSTCLKFRWSSSFSKKLSGLLSVLTISQGKMMSKFMVMPHVSRFRSFMHLTRSVMSSARLSITPVDQQLAPASICHALSSTIT